jgi:hypothetical protein
MDVATKLQLSRVLRSEALLVLATLSPSERAVLVEQLPGVQKRPVSDEDADRLVELGLAVRTTDGVDLTMLGRIAARVAYESGDDAPSIS